MKKIYTSVFILFVLSVFSNLTYSQTLSKETTQFIDNLLNSSYPEKNPGISILISENDVPVYKKAFGMSDMESGSKSDPENLYAIGSMTKQFTAVGILCLVNEGKINLNDDIRKYIPDYNTHGKTVTIENCLTHSSGIPSFTELKGFDKIYDKKLSKDEIVKYFQDEELMFDPGTDFSYSNSAYFLLGIVIENVSGMTYEDFIQKNIFDKAGMKHSYFGNWEKKIPLFTTGYESSDNNSYAKASYFDWSWPFSAGNIISSTSDLLNWNNALVNEKLIPVSLLKKAWSPYMLAGGVNSNYGYGWNVSQLNNYTIIKHGGAINGFLSDGIYIPEKKIYIAALSNNSGKSPDEVTNKILFKILNTNDEDPVTINLDKSAFDEYTGAFEVNRGGGRLLKNYSAEKQYRFISNGGDSLIMSRTGGGKSGFFPYAKDKFFLKKSGKRFEFIRNSEGKITAMEVYDYPVTLGPADICQKVNIELPTERKEITLTAESMKKFEGEYELQPGFILKFFVENGNLYVQPTGQKTLQMHPESENKFFLKEVDAQAEFVQDADGKVNSMIFTQGQKFECKRIK